VYSVDWSPDSRRLLLAVKRPHHGIGLAVARPWDPTRDMRMIRSPRALPRHLIIGPGVWSPDGGLIAFAATGSIRSPSLERRCGRWPQAGATCTWLSVTRPYGLLLHPRRALVATAT
jgi:hypothetical protein